MDLVAYEMKIPNEMRRFLVNSDKKTELQEKALLLYPYIHNQTISHGKAAELLGMNKYELIRIYEDLGIPYYSMDFSEVEEEVRAFHDWEGYKNSLHTKKKG